jgi:hypothetical protein
MPLSSHTTFVRHASARGERDGATTTDAGLATSAKGSADLPTAAPAATTDPLPPNLDPQTSAASSSSSSSSDDGWRAKIAIYGWFPGVHGTVGVLGHDTGFSVPFSDLFHYLKGVIPIAVDVKKGHFVMPIDYLWMKLGDDKGVPFTDPFYSSVNIDLTQSIFTPKVGYRLYDGEHFKVDALGGIRYWHLSQNLTLEPSGPSFGKSANWVDGLGGARFILPLSEKAAVTVAGDAGAGGANLDYQLIGLLTFQDSPGTDQAIGGLESCDTANGCRQSAGADSIRVEGCITQTGSDCGCRPARRPTGNVICIPGVMHAAKITNDRGGAHSQLVHIRLPEQDCAGFL